MGGGQGGGGGGGAASRQMMAVGFTLIPWSRGRDGHARDTSVRTRPPPPTLRCVWFHKNNNFYLFGRIY